MDDGRKCEDRARIRRIRNKIRQKISVPFQLHGKKVFVFGKSGDTKEAKEILEDEFRLVKKVLRTTDEQQIVVFLKKYQCTAVQWKPCSF